MEHLLQLGIQRESFSANTFTSTYYDLHYVPHGRDDTQGLSSTQASRVEVRHGSQYGCRQLPQGVGQLLVHREEDGKM